MNSKFMKLPLKVKNINYHAGEILYFSFWLFSYNQFDK
jgi:hypothetical protein